MINRTPPLPVPRQCQLLKRARLTADDHPTSVSETGLALMRRIDERHLQYPSAGVRRLRDLTFSRLNHVWAADITCLPMSRGFVYLFAMRDEASRRVLAWRLSNTLTTDFCLEAVQKALGRYGLTEIFTTDQGCQFASQEFTRLLTHHSIQVNMDGKGWWRESVCVERLWESIKYEPVYLHAYDTVEAAHQGLERYRTFYNQTRPHQALDGQTPDRVYVEYLTTRLTAA